GSEGFGRALHIGHVRLAVLVERRWHAHEERIALAAGLEVGRRHETATVDGFLDGGGGNVTDVALAPLEAGHLLGVDIETDDPEALLGEGEDERQADIA